MKQHKAKRLGTGWYKYRGWEIESVDDGKGLIVIYWSMKPLLADGEIDYIGFSTDSANTLSDAKAMIDRWEDEAEAERKAEYDAEVFMGTASGEEIAEAQTATLTQLGLR